ncbi:MAG: glutaredoxin family protein [Candidatus Brocadiales bacterium]|nr:glutaredoxin family protein [Candidatus Brocadiales bacterium]
MTELKVFTTTGCANCMQVKDYLKKAGIEFTECNIAESPEAAEELKRLGALSVPLIVCGDTIIHGFDRARLDELIACLTAAAV